jgi:hypothetical protein
VPQGPLPLQPGFLSALIAKANPIVAGFRKDASSQSSDPAAADSVLAEATAAVRAIFPSLKPTPSAKNLSPILKGILLTSCIIGLQRAEDTQSERLIAEVESAKFLDNLADHISQRPPSPQPSRNRPAIAAVEHAFVERRKLKASQAGTPCGPSVIESYKVPRYIDGISLETIDPIIKRIEAGLEIFLPGLQAASRPLESLTFQDKEARLKTLSKHLAEQVSVLNTLITTTLAAVRQFLPNYPVEPWENHSIELKKEYLARLEGVLSNREPKTRNSQADQGSVPHSSVQLPSAANFQVDESLQAPPATNTSVQRSQ